MRRINTYEWLHSLCKCLDLKKHFSNTATWLVQKIYLTFQDQTQSRAYNLGQRHGWGWGALTVQIVLSAVSAPTLKSEPGTLLETVAGMITNGMQSSSYCFLPSISSRPPV